MLAACLAASNATLADDASRQAPITLRADRIEIDQRTGLSRYLGHVVLTQGVMRLTADRTTVTRQGELLRSISAEGQPATFRDRPENQTDFVDGQAARIEYEALDRRLHLTGMAQIIRGEDRIRAGELHYNFNNETVIARSQDGQRVRAALMPQKKADREETP